MIEQEGNPRAEGTNFPKKEFIPKKILVVEDKFVTSCEISARLEDMGYEVVDVVGTGEAAINSADEYKPDIVMMDITLKGEMTGIEAAKVIKERYKIPIIFLTAHSDEATLDMAVKSEPFGYLLKPLDERALQTTLRLAIYKHEIDCNLQESLEKYRAIAEISDDCVFLLNSDLSIEFINERMKLLFNYDPDSSDRSKWEDIFSPEFYPEAVEIINKVISTGKKVRATIEGKINGEQVFFDTIFLPIFDEERKSYGEMKVRQITGTARDITKMVLLEKEMNKAGVDQLELNMEQFQILNDEIRNPVSIIIALCSMEETVVNQKIIDQAERINNIVNQLDKGWVQSEKVHSFLLKHYGHGKNL